MASKPQAVVTYGQVKAAVGSEPIVDVRTPREFAEGHIPSAVNVPLEVGPAAAQVMAREFAAAGIGRRDAAVVYCRSGKRALKAVELLRTRGYSQLQLYAGSWLDWQRHESQ